MASETVKKYVGDWLGNISPAEFSRLARNGESLVEQLKPYEGMVRAAKIFVRDFHMTSDELLSWIHGKYPQHGLVANTYRPWFDKQVHELTNYIDRL